MENKTIQQRAEEIEAKAQELALLQFPVKLETPSTVRSRNLEDVNEYARETFKDGIVTGALSMQPEIDRLQERVKELEEGLKKLSKDLDERPMHIGAMQVNIDKLLTKTQTP